MAREDSSRDERGTEQMESELDAIAKRLRGLNDDLAGREPVVANGSSEHHDDEQAARKKKRRAS